MEFSELRSPGRSGTRVAEQPAIHRQGATVILAPPTASTRLRRASRSGFSLIESMVVVAIVGIMAAMVLPAMTDMMANTRQSSAAQELMLLAQRARSEAMLGGKYAYSIVFQANAGGGDGAMAIITGVTAYCNRGTGVNFGNDAVTGILLPTGWQRAGGFVLMNRFAFGSHRIFGVADFPDGSTTTFLRICYTPGGESHVSNAALNQPVEQGQTAIIRINRSVNGLVRGVDRQVIFPPGGTARTR